jgi:hypothetical protein
MKATNDLLEKIIIGIFIASLMGFGIWTSNICITVTGGFILIASQLSFLCRAISEIKTDR